MNNVIRERSKNATEWYKNHSNQRKTQQLHAKIKSRHHWSRNVDTPAGGPGSNVDACDIYIRIVPSHQFGIWDCV